MCCTVLYVPPTYFFYYCLRTHRIIMCSSDCSNGYVVWCSTMQAQDNGEPATHSAMISWGEGHLYNSSGAGNALLYVTYAQHTDTPVHVLEVMNAPTRETEPMQCRGACRQLCVVLVLHLRWWTPVCHNQCTVYHYTSPLQPLKVCVHKM